MAGVRKFTYQLRFLQTQKCINSFVYHMCKSNTDNGISWFLHGTALCYSMKWFNKNIDIKFSAHDVFLK